MVLGRTGTAPNQGATIASETIQVTAVPLRHAAAQARAALLGLAAEQLGVRAADLTVDGRRRPAATGPTTASSPTATCCRAAASA